MLLERLTVAAEQDRGALGVALAGALARATDPALAARVGAALGAAPEGARDALLEGLGRMPGAAAGAALAGLAGGAIDDRRKIAEALAGHPEQLGVLVALAGDADPGVRAAATWSLGAVGDRSHLPALEKLIADPDTAVAGDAAASIGRIAARAKEPSLAVGPLCAALRQARPLVRANALEGLSLAGARCDAPPPPLAPPPSVHELLARDPSGAVRLAAADYLVRVIARDGDKASAADRRALARCAGEDRDGSVVTRCARPFEPTTGTDDVIVYVVPDGRPAPQPRAPFTLVRADGLLRLGLADRRGEIFEAAAPRGMIRLGVPAALAR
jgi:hypothetical protein